MEDEIPMEAPETAEAPALEGNDAVLDQLMTDAGDVAGEEPRPNFDGDEADEGEEKVETPEEQAEASTEGVGEADTAADVQEIDASLKAALERDGLPADLIESMLKADRDSVLKYALGRANNQKAVSHAYQERAELRKAADAEPGNEQEAEKPAQPELVDLDALAQPLIEELGEDAAGAVRKMLEAALQPVREQLQASEKAQATAREQQEQAALVSARHGLEERFPQIKDADAFDKLMGRVTRMAPGYMEVEGSLESVVVELMTDAARLEFGEETAPANPTRKQSRNQPTSPSRKTPQRAKSKDEQEFDILDALEKQHGLG